MVKALIYSTNPEDETILHRLDKYLQNLNPDKIAAFAVAALA